ncbi:HSP90 family protein [Kibdelosporangium philippinense]|uniref:HSP90 family protein n=1 Tax=Kibdelosporangium philippinense TaxID=211113 RepID=A0ABS8Z5L7_9PSEU|nr:HSP90 family protein [Kibdelosporangium philippinense]MCE7001863.1 HSP90 family protein [Kibdelosporangium philippinense]
MSRSFGVDLRGIIELLSQHLYSSPRVYIRELLQNAMDAITARDGGPAWIAIEPAEQTGDGTLRISDSGVGLTEDEVHTLLSTLGRTSKRDELGFARQNFLGQFGVGLLSCFLVADEIRLVSRSAKGGPAARWTADSSGTYEVVADDTARDEVGTTVTLVPRKDAEHWLQHDMVLALAREFGELLPVDVLIGDQLLTQPSLPWTLGADYTERMTEYCERTFGFRPFEILPLDIPAAGLTGAAFVMPDAAYPGSRQAHRIYLKRMLVGDSVEGLLPDWAYFVRCAVNSSALRPTASRESLYQDETLLAIRDELGTVLKDWLVRLGATEPDRAAALLAKHQLGMKSVALVDDELLRLVEHWLPFETTDGNVTLRQFRRRYNTILFTSDVDEFRQLAPVAQAQGLGLLNAGYAYDSELMRRLSEVDGPATTRRVVPSELLATMDRPDPAIEAELRTSLQLAQGVLDRHDCEAVPREFDPVSLPALLITDADRERQRDTAEISAEADPLWAELLGQLAEPASTASQQLVLNTRNPLVQRLSELTDKKLAELTVESLYVHALLQSRRPMRPKDTAALNRSFLDLLDRAVRR